MGRMASARRRRLGVVVALALAALAAAHFTLPVSAEAFRLKVADESGAPVSGFRYLVQRDNTRQSPPGKPVTDSVSLGIHRSHAEVVASGHTDGSEVMVDLPADSRYFVSVLPDADRQMGGAAVAVNQNGVKVRVATQPVPTAQISVLAFQDQNPINDGWDGVEPGVGNALITVNDFGGPVTLDVFGNPLGTRYDANGAVVAMGTGFIHTLTQEEFDGGAATNPYGLQVGEALVKYVAPGKYGITVTAPRLDDAGGPVTWIQTTTIEGTPVIDAWVKANEPRIFVEGFGTGFKHVAFGFVKTAPATPSTIGGLAYEALPWNVAPIGAATGSISGRLLWNHFAKPPFNQGYFPGEPLEEAWVGLNDPLAQPEDGQPAGLIALPVGADGSFTIPNVPDGTYLLVWWDKPLDALFGFTSVRVEGGAATALGDILAFRWFGTLQGRVFFDKDEDGLRDNGEAGIPEQNINLRFRDGSVYQAQPTDGAGVYEFSEVFPFFKWLVAEVDFARFKATGLTTVVDGGGAIPPHNGWRTPSFGKLNPQAQAAVNPATGNALSRTETGPVLTQAMHLFLNQTNVIDWGKANYAPGEHGGVSGVVWYDTTRAEDDASLNGAETWQPGIPDVQVALYEDNFNNDSGRREPDGRIDDVNGDGATHLADVDNRPWGWQGGGAKGPEDLDRNGNGAFDPGDAVAIAVTDSFDRSNPEDCIQNLPIIHGQYAGMCADNFSTWNQVRPGIFDGGYAFTESVPGGIVSGAAPVPLPRGTYIVEAAAPPGHELVKEEDKNVDFGDAYKPAQVQLLAPPCVGAVHTIPGQLTLFPGVEPTFAGQKRRLCDRKQVRVATGKNAAADFFFFTHVPKAARAVGFVNNDLAAEFNMASPNFGEKLSPPWIPISFRDWTGREVTRVYADEYGGYNALLPSTYTMNIPAPSGVSPSMLTLVLNDPYLPDGSLDPFHNPVFSVTPWTFQYLPGTTSYLDTPLVALAAFAAHGGAIDTEAQSLTPVVKSVDGPETGGGPVLCSARATDRLIRIASAGQVQIINPNYDPGSAGSPYRITRDYGFGATAGSVTIDGAPLTIVSWSDAEIVADVPAAIGASGRLLVTRGGNKGASAEVGLTFNVVDCATTTVVRVPADFPTIQAAIDAPTTVPGSLVLVAPGSYRENVILFKPVRLQGAGAGGTFIDGNPTPLERLAAWHLRVRSFGEAALTDLLGRNALAENEAPAIIVFGETPVGAETFDPGFPFDTPGQARVDGFTLGGSKAGGGLFALVGTHSLVVSNNIVTNNQGSYAGGIAIGVQGADVDLLNHEVALRFNKIHRNGGTQGPGGVALNPYSTDYVVEDNIIAGNFSRFNGGGIAHLGFSPGEGFIRRNRILYNEEFFGALLANAGDGGGIFVGASVVGVAGTGRVTIDANLIQGNLCGAGTGGGIRAFAVNAGDVAASPLDPTLWHRLTITNNVIANNVAGYSGAGISLQDVARATIDNNTIVNNDTTATSALAFFPGQPDSTPQPAGVVSHAHSAALMGLLAPYIATDPDPPEAAFSNPLLHNNVIRGNRSFYNNAGVNAGAGGLRQNVETPVWDLQVVGAPGVLDPNDCILSSLAYTVAGAAVSYDDGTNLAADPVFGREIVNDLASATVTDEGGNAITVRYTPLLPTEADYHLRAGSPAIDVGQDTAATADIDGDFRAAGLFDIGADEYVARTHDQLHVIAPNTGEVIPSGGAFTISWGAPAGAHHFSVALSRDNGASWTNIATNLTDTWFAWVAPRPRKNLAECLIRVTSFDAAGTRLEIDASNEPFTVEVVRLLTPNGGEVLVGGLNYTMIWETNATSEPVTKVNIEWSRDGGATWSLRGSPANNPGSFGWVAPPVGGLGTSVLLRVTLLAGATVVGQDQTDMPLTIRPPLVP